MAETAYEPLKTVGIIVDRSQGTRLVKYLNKNGFTYHFAMLGKGTAPSAIATYLGLSESDKAIVFAVVKESKEQELLELLRARFSEQGKNAGIAFSIGMQSVASKTVMDYLSTNSSEN